MTKKEVILLTFVFSILLAATFVSAADVAYIYKKDFKIDDNIIGTFMEKGLSVELINEKYLPANFDDYKLIFIGDERFRKELPVTQYPTIITNYHNMYNYGLTDRDGVSQLGSTAPLSVTINGESYQVYTQAFKKRRISNPYYFLDKENKAPSLETIASTVTTSSGYKFGDVIAYAQAGAQLENNKTAQENICFYGIIETDFWTPKAKELFKDCIDFVLERQQEPECNCPNTTISEPFCQDNNLYQTQTNYSCECDECEPHVSTILIEECEFGCEYEQCLPEPTLEELHDIALINLTDAVNNIQIKFYNEEQVWEPVLGNELQCNTEYKLTIKVENKGNSTENITFIGSIGEIVFNHNPIDNFAPTKTSTKWKKVLFDLTPGTYNLTIVAFLNGVTDDNPEDNTVVREVSVVC